MNGRPLTRVGLQLTGFTRPGVRDRDLFKSVADTVLAAEAHGFDSVWIMDHLHQISTVGEPDEPILEAYTTLAALSAVTSSVRLGALVSACGFRNPALLAKMVTTIDVISGGRAILGIGAGWHEDEYRAYGFDFHPPRQRLWELEKAVEVCRTMFLRPEGASAAGVVDGALNIPPPVTPGGPPILIGGGGEKVLIPMVARLADACNFFGAPATVRHKLSALERACAAVGRSSSEITKTWLGMGILVESEWQLESQLQRMARLYNLTPRAVRGFALCGTREQIQQQVAGYRAVGVDGIIVSVLDASDVDHVGRLGAVLQDAMAAS